jgi:hypothetical protein
MRASTDATLRRMRAGNGVAAWLVVATGALAVGAAGCGQAFSAGGEGGPDATADVASDGGSSSGDTGGGTGPGDSGKPDGPGGGDGGFTDGSGATDGPAGMSDGALACTRPDGGQASDPGFVTCGGTKCDLTSTVCCQLGKGAEASVSPPTCVAPSVGCPALEVRVACDENADCQHGNVCCVDLVTGAQTCAASCGTGLELCRCDQQCTGSPCIVCPGYERCTAQCG